MYRELEAADHQRMLGLTPGEVPDVLLLLGVLAIEARGAHFARHLDSAEICSTRYPAYIGTYRGLRVGLAACFGGPMAAMHTHTFCAAGVSTVIQLGWFGALQRGTGLADVIVPPHAERQDGASDWYLPKGILADATPELSAAIVRELKNRQITVHEDGIYSTPALLAESRDVIADWSRHGYLGVDMETAATFAVAKSLGARRAAALIRIDDLVAETHGLASEVDAADRAVLRAREPEVTHAVLDAVISLSS
jgi:uridine phosphorylase